MLKNSENAKPMVGRRILAFTVDTLLFLFLTFFAYGFVGSEIVKRTTNASEVSTEYQADSRAYEELQEEYGIYYYDANSTRTYNSNVTEEDKQAFLADERVIALSEKIGNEQNQILGFFFIGLAYAVGLTCLIENIALPLIFRKGRTVGKLIMRLAVIDKDEKKYLPWWKVIVRYSVYSVLNSFLGIATVGLLPVANLVVAILTKDNRSIHDLIAGSRVVDSTIPLSLNETIEVKTEDGKTEEIVYK